MLQLADSSSNSYSTVKPQILTSANVTQPVESAEVDFFYDKQSQQLLSQETTIRFPRPLQAPHQSFSTAGHDFSAIPKRQQLYRKQQLESVEHITSNASHPRR